MNLMVNGQVSI